MVINFTLGDSLKEKLLKIGFKQEEAKEFVKEIDETLDKKIESSIDNNFAKNLKDLATKEDIKEVNSEIRDEIADVKSEIKEVKNKIFNLESKIDKLLYVIIGFMSSLVVGLIFLIIRFGNF